MLAVFSSKGKITWSPTVTSCTCGSRSEAREARGEPMNWKLVIQLSIFGLVMALATVFVVPSNAEPFFWLPIFLITAYLIAKQAPGRYFLHGLALGLVNCFWVTAAHILLFNRYIATHPQEAAMMTRMPMPD